MVVKDITDKEKKDFNRVASHPLQSYEWGEFRKKTGVKVIRRGFFKNNKIVDGFQLTIHKIPRIPWTIGYLPKGNLPTKDLIDELYRIGRAEKCIFIQLEPNIEIGHLKFEIGNLKLIPSTHPLFTKYTFILDLTKSEEELLKNMHPKTRYNIKVAQKHGVEIIEDPSPKAFESYLELTSQTTKRQKFYAHKEEYHRKLWKTLKVQSSPAKPDKVQSLDDSLNAHLLTAKYNFKILAVWILFIFHDTLYYPYGASSSEHKNVMASNLMMWETIKFGKKLGLKKFDMWGSLGPSPNPKDPWYGFHKFKEGYGSSLTEFMGSYDLIINTNLYRIYKIADKMRWTILRLRK